MAGIVTDTFDQKNILPGFYSLLRVIHMLKKITRQVVYQWHK